MARPRRLHSLARPKLRQSWNKYNLYNISQFRDPRIGKTEHETFFQQKWRAKGFLRAYHGEHIRERDWTRMFSRRLLSVAEMHPRSMAESDGSSHAAGRGSGKEMPPKWDEKEWGGLSSRGPATSSFTPYMNMTFAPMERRLDIAIFRALFASSARQARQLCVHGHVKVNGKLMPHPSYRLNPGDMFQVDPESVMYCTGAAKAQGNVPFKDQRTSGGEEEVLEATLAASENAELEDAESEAAPADSEANAEVKELTSDQELGFIKSDLKEIKKMLEISAKNLSVRQKRIFRQFRDRAKKAISKAGRDSGSTEEMLQHLRELVQEKNAALSTYDAALANSQGLTTTSEVSGEDEASTSPASSESLESSEMPAARKRSSDKLVDMNEGDRTKLSEIMARLAKEDLDNPRDDSKPYATPWSPRPFMAPFAFIPKYLEVNQNVCAAVYLRHPVARKGYCEVPTPFPLATNELAFNWYLRRR